MKNIISLIKYTRSPESLKSAVELCNGFNGLHKDDKVLVKPNLDQWDKQFKIAPFGVFTPLENPAIHGGDDINKTSIPHRKGGVKAPSFLRGFTTTRLIEDLVILLRDYGCKNISIGEGSIEAKKGIGTMEAFVGLGYNEISKRYGVSLIDFNKSKAVPIEVNENNSNIKEAIIIKGCPSKYEDVVASLKDVGLEIKERSYFEYLDEQGRKYDRKEGYSWDFFNAGKLP